MRAVFVRCLQKEKRRIDKVLLMYVQVLTLPQYRKAQPLPVAEQTRRLQSEVICTCST